ncbi:hypothetical protein LguiA_005929 [Lonicera macranthoides]
MAASSSSLPSSFKEITHLPSRKYSRTHHQSIQVRARSFRDEGKSSNIVDANLRVLRERMEEIKMKERLERCCSREQYGWNYSSSYDYKHKREANLSECFELISLVGGTIGLTILSGTFLLCLISLIVHLNQ